MSEKAYYFMRDRVFQFLLQGGKEIDEETERMIQNAYFIPQAEICARGVIYRMMLTLEKDGALTIVETSTEEKTIEEEALEILRTRRTIESLLKKNPFLRESRPVASNEKAPNAYQKTHQKISVNSTRLVMALFF